MKTMGKVLWLTVALMFLAVPIASARSAPPEATKKAGDEGIMVGRISHVEGQMLRYVPEEKDWVAIVQDTPFGFNDALYAGQDGKAEVILPNNTWERIGSDTQLQMIALKPDVTEIDVASGITRFFNRSGNAVVKATTPFGYVTAEPGTSFDLYVGDKSVEVIALKGKVDFIHVVGNTKFEVAAGSGSIVADSQRTAPGEGNVDADWDDWNVERDKLWTQRLAVKGESTENLPSQLQGDAYTLEENGRWERVYYEGSYRNYWRPTTIDAGWSPYTNGRWSVYYEDNCWVPYEPFGYVTHHYGSWVYANSYWYWAPPVVSVSVGPAIGWGWGFGWYPGRVSWIYSAGYVGWVPLAPFEPYYAHRYWGPGVTVAVGLPGISINIGGLAWLGHAVIVPHGHFYGGHGYGGVRVTNINRTTIINNYNTSPVVNNRVISNYNTLGAKYAVTNTAVTNRPAPGVVNRIQRNQDIARRTGAGITAQSVTRGVNGARAGTLQRTAAVDPPRVTSKMSTAGGAGTQGAQRDLKGRAAAPKQSEGFMQGGATGQTRQGLGKSGQTGQATTGAGTIQAPRSDQRVKSTTGSQQGQAATGSRGSTSTSRSREGLSTGSRSGQTTGVSRGTDSTSRGRSVQSTDRRTTRSQDLQSSRGSSTDRSLQRSSRSNSQLSDTSRRSRTSSGIDRSQSRSGSSSSLNRSRGGSSSSTGMSRGQAGSRGGQAGTMQGAPKSRGGNASAAPKGGGGHSGGNPQEKIR